jgi:hypothetical protein
MKFTKIVTVILAVASLSLSAFAQRGFDTYAIPRTLIVAAPALYSGGAAGPATNSWVDVRVFDGTAKLDIFCVTNVANSAFTISLQGSMDQTNLTAIGNCSVASSTSIIYTNTSYGSNNLTATDVFNLPGVVTTPTASTAGWATSYLLPNPFTNTITAYSPAQGGVTTIGFNVGDSPRYLRMIVLPSGAATNGVVGAVLTGHVNF